MFSSLASFLFGSNTSAIADSETTAKTILTGETCINRDSANLVDADNLIEVTSLTPSVTGTSGRGQQQGTEIKRGGKNKRNNTRQKNKRNGVTKNGSNSKALQSSLTNLLTPSDSCDEDIDEDEWYIVEREDEEDDSPSRTDSERENTPVNEIVKFKPAGIVPSSLAKQRRLQHINLHSLYSGPRPQKQRDYLQKARGNTNSRSSGLSVSTLSPSRIVNVGRNVSVLGATADGGITRSLYVASATNQQQQPQPIIMAGATAASVGIVNANNKMDESCMSVYHSIKSAQEATESFIKLDISVNEKPTEKIPVKKTPAQRKNTQAVQQRSSVVAQLKQQLLARSMQMTQSKMERKDICRSAIKRANKVRDVQSKNHTKRRSDRQYTKVVSNANNNRKTASCY